jgi:predicted nucleic acid-binding protein
MKNIMVDTSVWIDFFNRKNMSPETDLLRKLIENNKQIYICPVVLQEILQGIRDDKLFEKIKKILLKRNMVDINLMDVTNKAIDIYRTLRKKGITIRKSMDCLIAAYAIIGKMYLLHKDNDFTEIAKECKLKILNKAIGAYPAVLFFLTAGRGCIKWYTKGMLELSTFYGGAHGN